MDTSPRTASPVSFLFAAAVATSLLSAQAQKGKPMEVLSDNATAGLPKFLHLVPGGSVTMGLTLEQLIDLACEAVSPGKPEIVAKSTDENTLAKVRRNLDQTASELGVAKVPVATFLLGKTPVTNRQYEAFMKRAAAGGQKIRPPYHWWRYGRKDDYDKRLEEIHKLFKDAGRDGPIFYWLQYGIDLPYELKDDKGRSIADDPVVFVSYYEALRFAAWLGMRLPTEAEWTRAARGDSNAMYVWGTSDAGKDRFLGESTLKDLGLYPSSTETHTKPVGTIQFLNGPYGHHDMASQVWEYMSQVGFAPINGQDAFQAEWKKTVKHKLNAMPATPPAWKGGAALIKGGSFYSWQDPVQFHIDCRYWCDFDNPVEGIGFRLAKSLRPGYDLIVSMAASGFDRSLFNSDQKQDIDGENQIGAERYEYGADDFPTAFHAVSAAPVNWITNDSKESLKKVLERSQVNPVLVGALACTEKMKSPALEPDLYSIGFRNGGMPKELTDAISAGHKAVQAELKRKAKAKSGDEAPAEGESKPDPWRTVLAKYGLTEKDLEPADAKEKLKFVRLDAIEVSTEQDMLVFSRNGKWVGSAPAASRGKDGLIRANLQPSEIAAHSRKIEGTEHAAFEFRIRTPLLKDQKHGVEFRIELILEQGPAAASEIWRLPASVAPAPGSGGSNNKVEGK